MEIRVYYEDTDSGGVVYYANYLRFCERARTEFFRERGVDVGSYDAKGIIFVVARVEADYRAPARYNDLLSVETSIIESSGASFTFHQRIFRKESRQLMVEARIKLVCVGEKGRPSRLPAKVQQVVEASVRGAGKKD